MKILKDLSLIKYGITGIFITIFHTIIFVFLSNYFSRVLIILILEPSAYALKFTIYKLWVFKKGKVNIYNYIMHITPLYFIAIFITKITEGLENIKYVILMLILINGLIGYLWGKYLYSSKNKIFKFK
tara:strand:+ start:1957 stop:2340 length:384 start_codon:yes stop_codon:yes gene_type:complete